MRGPPGPHVGLESAFARRRRRTGAERSGAEKPLVGRSIHPGRRPSDLTTVRGVTGRTSSNRVPGHLELRTPTVAPIRLGAVTVRSTARGYARQWCRVRGHAGCAEVLVRVTCGASLGGACHGGDSDPLRTFCSTTGRSAKVAVSSDSRPRLTERGPAVSGAGSWVRGRPVRIPAPHTRGRIPTARRDDVLHTSENSPFIVVFSFAKSNENDECHRDRYVEIR